MTVAAAPQAKLLTERRFFSGMALALAITTFVGFAPTYYLAGFNDAPTPPLTPSIHIHGAFCTAWVLLLVLQTQLIAAKRWDIHKVTGAIGVLIALAVLVTGFNVAINSERRVLTDANAGTLGDPYVFFAFPVFAVGIFALFVALAILNRERPDFHKRFMLLATMSMIVPALARIVTQTTEGIPGALGALVLVNVFLLALVIYDFASRSRLHPATLWGGGALLISEPLRVVIGHTVPWREFARAVMG